MIVTDLQYSLEKLLVNKLNIMIERCSNTKIRKDALLIVEGAEGEGKTNTSLAIGYYASYVMKRPLHMFFRLEALKEFAQSTEKKIIIWDEPALDSLSTDWYKETSKDLIRLLMLCRKKRHFFIFNFVFFKSFNRNFVRRALGMVHMYSRKQVIPGRFFYIKKGDLFKLYKEYDKIYDMVYKKYKKFGGNFPIVEQYMGKMNLTIEKHTNADLELYETLKDRAILSIGKHGKEEDKYLGLYKALKRKIGFIQCPIPNRDVLAAQLGISERTMANWRKIETNNPPLEGVSDLEPL